jgi:hypothetical protein
MSTEEFEITYPIPTEENAKTILFGLLHSARQVYAEFPDSFNPEAATELHAILMQLGGKK